MNYDEYRLAAPKTCNPEAWCLEHFVDGFVNEAAELHSLTKKRHYDLNEEELIKTRFTDLVEEIGDLCWFLSCFFTWFDEQGYDDFGEHTWEVERPMDGQVDLPLHRLFNKLVHKASKALDYVDYAEMHRDLSNGATQLTPAPMIYGLAHDMRYWLNVVRIKLKLKWEDIFVANIAKLQGARYKGGWSKEKALSRDTEAEYNAMEARNLITRERDP